MKDRIRVTAMLMAAMAAGYIGGLMSQASTKAATRGTKSTISETVKAKRFELVDAEGNARGMFYITSHGDPGLVLNDSAGNARAGVGIYKGEPGLELDDSAGNALGMFTLSKGEPCLEVCDARGTERGEFGMVKGEPKLSLLDSAGNERGVFVTVNGEPRLDLCDAAGRPQAALLGRGPEGSSGLGLFDPAGEFTRNVRHDWRRALSGHV